MNQQQSNQQTLRDLVRPILANKWLVMAVVIIAVAASLGYAKTRKTTYSATAALAVQDESRDLGLVGLRVTPIQTPGGLAAAAAQIIAQPAVAARVKHALGSRERATALLDAVSTTVQPSSNLVEIEASESTAARARDLANAFAYQGAALLNKEQRQLYASALSELTTPGDIASRQLYGQQVSRLRELSLIASPAQVVTPAKLPRAPSSQKLLRTALLAGAFGLVIGLLLVYIRESFDRPLRTVQDVEQQLAFPMLGHVRHDALGQSPRLNSDRGASVVDWELFRIMRRNLDFLDDRHPMRTVAVTSPLPEEGKSTVAAFLTFVSAAAGKRTLLIECDLRRPVLADRLGIDQTPGLSDFLMGRVQATEVLQVVRFSNAVSSNGDVPVVHGSQDGAENRPELYTHELACISAGTPTPHPVELFRSDALGAALETLGSNYDLVVLDTPAMLSVVDTLELLPNVDAALVCVRVYKTTRQQAAAGMAALARLPQRPTGVVVTGTRPGKDAEYGYFGYY